MRTRQLHNILMVPTLLVGLGACSGERTTTDEPGNPGSNPDSLPDGEFESAHPAGILDDNGQLRSAGKAGETTPASGQAINDSGNFATAEGDSLNIVSAATTTPDDAQAGQDGAAPSTAARAIEEADIIKIDGDRLYALSALGGLSIVDVSDPDKLKLLGRHRTTATPFEMYVRGNNVFVLYNGYGEYEYSEDEDIWTYYQTSYVISLDTEDPVYIQEAQKFEIEGFIADSRVIGDVMYVAAFDDSYCYRCGDQQETNVLALNLSDPADITKADELSFEERDSQYSWRRSLTATEERLYIAGPRYGDGNDPEGSVIRVVDISDTSGDMVAGDSLVVAGQINSRWQMDEYDGVLRVISQPLSWRSEGVPIVETFTIESSKKLTPLASLPLELPRPETLQSVRFDGPRAYAITFEQTDPLFTIDLSDPAAPLQAGQLEMPGWVHFMEPRGERLIGLGFDQGNPEGSLTVSLFDVSDLASPTMLDRVNFGGDGAQLAEDQDRIHKSFQVLDSHEMVLVPFSGWTWNDTIEDECREDSSQYTSGVQLIDWSDDTLTLRGVADSHGQARRAFFVEDRLLTMSNERLESFDITDRDAPTSTSQVELAQIVNQLATAGDTIVRIGSGWWNDSMEATVSSLKDLKNFRPGIKVELPELNNYDCESETWLEEIKSGANSVYFISHSYQWNQGEEKEELKVLTLNVEDPKKPEVDGNVTLDLVPGNGRNYVPGMVNHGAASVSVGESLVFAQHDMEYNNLGYLTKNDYSLEVIDLSNPAKPKSTSLTMPNSLGSTGLVVSDTMVASSHFSVSPDNANAVRFFLDRADLSNPSKPELMTPVNIPGSLLSYDAEHERALTVDYQYVTVRGISPKQCYEEEFGEFQTQDRSVIDYETARGDCVALRFTLNLLDISDDTASLVDSKAVEKGVQINAVAIGDDRVFLGTSQARTTDDVYYGAVSEPAIGGSFGFNIGYYSYRFEAGEAKLLVVSGLAEGELIVSSATVETGSDFYGFNHLLAHGKKAVMAAGWQGHLSVIDASDAEKPVIESSTELAGYVSDLDMAGDVAIVALGEAGVQTLRLSKELE